MMWAQAPNDVGLCPNDVGGTAFALPPNDVPRGTPLPPARREYSKAKPRNARRVKKRRSSEPRNTRRSETIIIHSRQPLRPDYRRRAQTDAESAFASRRCIYILQEGANADRKTNSNQKEETRSRTGVPRREFTSVGGSCIRERVSTLFAFYYAGFSSKVESINGLYYIIHSFFGLR